MNYRDICLLALRVRTAQKRFFKERTQSALVESKNLEKELDAALDAAFREHDAQTPTLFPAKD